MKNNIKTEYPVQFFKEWEGIAFYRPRTTTSALMQMDWALIFGFVAFAKRTWKFKCPVAKQVYEQEKGTILSEGAITSEIKCGEDCKNC